MLAFILRRLGQAVLVMLTVGFIAFSLFRFVGDPVLFMLGQDSTPEDRERITRLLGLDQPFYVQYAKFVGRTVQGEFGLSLRQVQPVSRLFVERLPAISVTFRTWTARASEKSWQATRPSAMRAAASNCST